MEGSEFARIRHYLGKSQGQIARLLCISPKTVQSFEQGLRHIPSYIERQMQFFISLKMISHHESIQPCWELTDCPSEWRANCFAWEIKAKNFCWLINGTFCKGRAQENWTEKSKLCHECKVYKLMVPEVN